MSGSAETFNPRTMLWAVLASMMAAGAFFLLSTYAPDFRLSGAGGGTPLSKSGDGFAGLVELLGLLGEEPVLARSDADLDKAALLIVPLTVETPRDGLQKLVERRADKATLFVLPKWVVIPLPDHPGWDSRVHHYDPSTLDGVLRTLANSHVKWTAGRNTRLQVAGASVSAPEDLQWIPDTDPIVVSVGPGQALIARIVGTPHYILADPDMLDNQGLADRDRAAAMLRVLQRLRPNAEPIMFDLTLLGAGHGRSLQKLLVEPPFLALTLALLATGALALAHGFVRFGPAAAEARAIAFGKYALTDTTARLFRRAGRLGTLGERYAALLRTRAGTLLGAPATATADDLQAWLDRAGRDDIERFGTLSGSVAGATSEADLHDRALALHDWVQRRKRDR